MSIYFVKIFPVLNYGSCVTVVQFPYMMTNVQVTNFFIQIKALKTSFHFGKWSDH